MKTFRQIEIGDKVYKSCPLDTFPKISEYEVVKIVIEKDLITLYLNPGEYGLHIVSQGFDKSMVNSNEYDTRFGIHYSTSPTELMERMRALIVEYGEKEITNIQNQVVSKLKSLEGNK